jgi:peptidoglycan glycosyltransferase
VNTDPPRSDLDPNVVGSVGPKPGSFKANAPLFALAAIGQGEIAVTPLEMALVAQSVATGGVILEPHVAQRIEDADGNVVRRIGRKEVGRAMDPATAAKVRDFMLQVVQRGTGTAAQIPGVEVAGKTGTAELGPAALEPGQELAPGEDPPQDTDAWFTAFAPAADPKIAVAVMIVNSDGDGGTVAAPIVRQIMADYFEVA